MEKVEKILKGKFLLPFLILLLSLPAVFWLAAPGFWPASDDLHVGWLHQMDRAVASGQMPPRWAPDLSFGFGYPLFSLVYPLPFYIGEIFHLLGLSLVSSLKAVFFLSLPLSGLAMYLFARRHFGRLPAFVAAALYLWTPYRAVDIYVRGAVGEAFSFIFFPLVAFGFWQVVSKGRKRDFGLASLSLAGLVLSHNLAFLMMFPPLLAYGVLLAWIQKEKIASLVRLAGAVGLGLAASAYFWLPAAVERGLFVAATVFNYRDHFPFIYQLIIPAWGYGASVWGPGDGFSFQVGVVNLIALAAAIILGFLLWRKLKAAESVLFLWGGGTALVALFLMNIRSSFIWEAIPVLPFFQFPWRFLTVTTFATSFLAGLVVSTLPRKWTLGAFVVFFLASVVFVPFYFRPERMLPRDDTYFINRYIPTINPDGSRRTTASDEYKLTQEEYLRLPKATLSRPEELASAKITSEEAEVSIISEELTSYEAEIKAEEKAQVSINTYAYPGWQASLDGERIEVIPGEPYGQMMVRVPAGTHRLKVWFSETPFRLSADLVSLVALLFSLVLLVPQGAIQRVWRSSM